MSSPVVKCSVEQCTHYMDGNQCMAAKVSIYNGDVHSKSKTIENTQCKSFHQRETMGDMVGAFHNSNISGTMAATLIEGTQLKPDVECFVNNCKHWHSSNLCNAGHIDVIGMNAAKTTDTDCKTFVEK